MQLLTFGNTVNCALPIPIFLGYFLIANWKHVARLINSQIENLNYNFNKYKNRNGIIVNNFVLNMDVE